MLLAAAMMVRAGNKQQWWGRLRCWVWPSWRCIVLLWGLHVSGGPPDFKACGQRGARTEPRVRWVEESRRDFTVDSRVHRKLPTDPTFTSTFSLEDLVTGTFFFERSSSNIIHWVTASTHTKHATHSSSGQPLGRKHFLLANKKVP